MKIVYNLSTIAASGGGMERVIVDKMNYLADKLNYEVIFITTDQEDKTPFYPLSSKIRHIDFGLNYDVKMRNLSIINKYLPYRRLLKEHRLKLEKLLFTEKPDIVCSLSRDEKEFLYKIKDGSKKVLESHRCLKPRAWIEFRKSNSIIEKIKILYRLIHDTRLPKYYDKFIVLTEEDKSFWKEKNNVLVIPNPLPFYTDIKPDYSAKKVLCVGRISFDKGLDRLLKIWSKVVSQFPEWKLSLVGDLVDRELKSYISELKIEENVELIPTTQDIMHEYQSSSIYVMTSRFEGLPMVLLEAISMSLPIVSYSFKCGPKDVINNGIDGFLVEEGDEDTFVEKLSLLMGSENLRRTMGTKAKENSQRFSPDNIMKKWDSLFTELTKS